MSENMIRLLPLIDFLPDELATVRTDHMRVTANQMTRI